MNNEICALVINYIEKDNYYIAYNNYNEKVIIQSTHFHSQYPKLKKRFFITYSQSNKKYNNSLIVYPENIEIYCFFPPWTNNFTCGLNCILYLLDIEEQINCNTNNYNFWDIIQNYLMIQSKDYEIQKKNVFFCIMSLLEKKIHDPIIKNCFIINENETQNYEEKFNIVQKNIHKFIFNSRYIKNILYIIDCCKKEFK